MTRLFLSCCVLSCLTPFLASQNGDQGPSLGGRWVLTSDYYGTPRYSRMQLEQNGDKLSGTFLGEKLDGTVSGSRVHFVAKDDSGGTSEVDATVENGKMTGEAV